MDRSKRMKRFEAFDKNEKIKLITTIQNCPVLWDISHKRHFDQMVLKQTWNKVANQNRRSVADCRGAWNSLRDSLRYHRAKAAKNGANTPNGKDTVDWEFADLMSFLPHASEKRSSVLEFMKSDESGTADYSSPLNSPTYEETATMIFKTSDEESCAGLDESPTPGNSNSFTYAIAAKQPKSQEHSPDKLIGLIENYFKEAPKTERTIFPYWNELLNKMPTEIATDMEVEVTVMLHAKLRALNA